MGCDVGLDEFTTGKLLTVSCAEGTTGFVYRGDVDWVFKVATPNVAAPPAPQSCPNASLGPEEAGRGAQTTATVAEHHAYLDAQGLF